MGKFFSIASIAVLSFLYWIYSVGSLPIQSGEYIIPSGSTFYSLPSKLNITIQPLRYRIWIRFFAPERGPLLAGVYQISSNTPLKNAWNKDLLRPVNLERTLTILPGWNLFDIEKSLKDQNLLTGSLQKIEKEILSEQPHPFLKGVKSLEGFLYPDTYKIALSATPKDILLRLLQEFDTRIYKTSQSLSSEKFYDTIIIASLIEREERNPSEQSTVSGIIQNRLQKKMALGIDATTCYPYGLTQKECTPAFIGNNILVKTPYNTRLISGLPPTPISNFSSQAWFAANNPNDTQYLYYLHDTKGRIYYASTLQEHNENKREKMWR